ncbi:MAG: hypothetical protein KKE41_17975, partial [Gammaproteobacteria bacterium]|nr:hypothetical protein [Gammaproteobacteria bacterium]
PVPVGYTLPTPLLQLFLRQPDGNWALDTERIERIVRTVRDSTYPVILYLFATHFSTDAPIEVELATDSRNLAQTRDGPMSQSLYYDSAINNWSLASTQNALTERRTQAATALLKALCRLPAEDLAKIKGLTLLGEVHHLFPDFEAGMGFDMPYRVTDYSAKSVADFREYLTKEFRQIEQFNRVVGTTYTSFDEVDAPSRDIRTEPLRRYTEHIDSFAHGSFPVSGWAFVRTTKHITPAWVHIYINGEFAGRTPVDKGRQDVLLAKPEFGSANTGWRWNLDYRRLPAGLHRVNVFLESAPGQLIALGMREFAVMDKQQNPPVLQPQKPLPAHLSVGDSVQAYIDQPKNQASYYYNPLVPLWHTFRGRQVAEYLKFFDNVVNQSCMSSKPHFTHQILPFANPSWDENKFAIDASLNKAHTGNIRLGVSLYGDASYGQSFNKWYAASGHRSYGVTEFHPLKAMNAIELNEVFDMHAENGAAFLSFFVEPHWKGEVVNRGHNLFSFDPANQKFGSDELYRAAQQLLGTGVKTPASPRTQ